MIRFNEQGPDGRTNIILRCGAQVGRTSFPRSDRRGGSDPGGPRRSRQYAGLRVSVRDGPQPGAGRRSARGVPVGPRYGRTALPAAMKDRSPLPIRYPICRAIVTATAVNTIDQPSSARATLAPVATMSAKLMAGSRMRTLKRCPSTIPIRSATMPSIVMAQRPLLLRSNGRPTQRFHWAIKVWFNRSPLHSRKWRE